MPLNFSRKYSKVQFSHPIRGRQFLWTNQQRAKYFCRPIRFKLCKQATGAVFTSAVLFSFSQQWRLQEGAKNGILLMIAWLIPPPEEMESLLTERKVIDNKLLTSSRTWDSVYKCKTEQKIKTSDSPQFLIIFLFQDSIMHQHSNRLHAEVLHVPLVQQVPQKPHCSSCFVPGCQGTLYLTFTIFSDFVHQKSFNHH